ncbi:MAG TPA: hypothetical protein VHO68_13255 [Bacteroidales bacterium]|nr:hypothetical protein [Bacteroidales bacterium]
MDNIGEILVPIIIFIIWTLASIAENKKKRKRQPAPEPAGHPVPQPSQPQQSAEGTSTTSTANPMEDLKKSLDKLFGEMSEESNAPAEEKQPVPEYEEEAEPTPEYRKEMEPAPEYRNKEVTSPVVTPKESYKERFKKEQAELSKIYESYTREGERTSVKISHESLRKAIILMEVLSPPLALRE